MPAGPNSAGTTISGDKITTGKVHSNNWGTAAGTQLDLDNAKIIIGGSANQRIELNGTHASMSFFDSSGARVMTLDDNINDSVPGISMTEGTILITGSTDYGAGSMYAAPGFSAIMTNVTAGGSPGIGDSRVGAMFALSDGATVNTDYTNFTTTFVDTCGGHGGGGGGSCYDVGAIVGSVHNAQATVDMVSGYGHDAYGIISRAIVQDPSNNQQCSFFGEHGNLINSQSALIGALDGIKSTMLTVHEPVGGGDKGIAITVGDSGAGYIHFMNSTTNTTVNTDGWKAGINSSEHFIIYNEELNKTAIEIEEDNDIWLRTDSVRVSLPGGAVGLELGYDTDGDHSSFLDFWGSAAETDWDSRIIRNGGVNGNWVFTNEGTGYIKLDAGDAKHTMHDDGEHQFSANYSGEAFEFKNDGNNDNREGLSIECGKDSNPGTTMSHISFRDGNGTGLDWLTGDGAGGCRFTGTAQATYSDIRNKNSIKPIGTNKSVSDILDSIEVFEFKYNSYDWMPDSVKAKKDSEIRIGVSAQQMEEIIPEVVVDNEELNIKKGNKIGDSGYKWKEVKYDELVPLLLQSRKEQNNKIKMLEDKINKLEEILNANNS